MKFNEYKNLNLTEVNHSTLDRWNGLNLFERTVHTREGAPSFVFFEGPPSANGHPRHTPCDGPYHQRHSVAATKPCAGIR